MPRRAFGDYGVLENVVFWRHHFELANTVGSDLSNVHGVSRPETNCFRAFKKKRLTACLKKNKAVGLANKLTSNWLCSSF
jgi:hypothetical protein